MPSALIVDGWPDSPVICGSGLGSTLLKLSSIADACAAGWELSWLSDPEKTELLELANQLSARMVPSDAIEWSRYDRVVNFGLKPSH